MLVLSKDNKAIKFNVEELGVEATLKAIHELEGATFVGAIE